MAIREALEAIAKDWADVEPRLSVAQLSLLAATSDLEDAGESNAFEVFQEFARVLPAHHPAWQALATSSTRRTKISNDRDARTYLQIGALARQAIASEWIVADAGAEAVTEIVRRQVLGYGFRLMPLDQPDEATRGLIGVPLDQGTAYPAFQFADRELSEPHAVLVNVNEMIGADSDPIGALSWWWSPNTWLDTRPAFLLGTEREPELTDVARQLFNDSW